ncbi:MAG: hypothetical protein AAFY36_03840 [Bacteroidota bacterium]
MDRPTLLFYRVLLAMQLLWLAVSVYLIWGRPALEIFGGRNDFWLAVGCLLVLLAAAWLMDNNRRQQATRWRFDDRGKRMHYRHTVFIRSALIQAANLLALNIGLIARRWETILLLIPGLMIYWHFRPRAEEIEARYANSN